MHFPLNSFQPRVINSWWNQQIEFINLAETSLSYIRRLSHNRGLSSTECHKKVDWTILER